MPNNSERKNKLIAAGAFYRAGILDARNSMHASIDAKSFIKNAIASVAMIGYALLKGRAGTGSGILSALIPLALRGIRGAKTASKKSWARPILGIVAVVGTVATIAVLATKKKRATRIRQKI